MMTSLQKLLASPSKCRSRGSSCGMRTIHFSRSTTLFPAAHAPLQLQFHSTQYRVKTCALSESNTSSAPPPRRIAIFVEPSPFTYVCGYANRFTNTIRSLVEQGSEVLVITTGKGVTLPGTTADAFEDPPAMYHGAHVMGVKAFGCPLYWAMPISLALSPRVFSRLKSFNPDIIHCSSPGLMLLAASLYARTLQRPLVLSYHTHLPAYLPKYRLGFLVNAMWLLLRLLHAPASLILTTSDALRTAMCTHAALPLHRVDVWRKAVDTDVFHPKHRTAAMRRRLCGGVDHAGPLLVYVGRLGAEKNLDFLQHVLPLVPNARLAFVGDGPARPALETVFADNPNVVFAGMLRGKALSQAYASADVFVMPSESETLGFVVLEAMASGIPVVAVNAGGIPNIIDQPGQTGFLYNSGDHASCARMVNALVNDDALYSRVQQAALTEVRRLDWGNATEYLLTRQYALAIATAAAVYGRAMADVVARWDVEVGGGDVEVGGGDVAVAL